MATKLAAGSGPTMHQHAAGIFADMSVDGPNIGVLVMIVDRAKNLPNRKTMGKQNPYCAARLGKEAKKTETDKRGGQTPRWDQELRFAVHDSPDYYTLKVSVFSEDKRTDLIGEAWINLAEVIVPGGGKSDAWQGLNCKGKYAGEVRIELTYYDSRPKPELRRESSTAEEDARGSTRVKRRPLPSGNGSRGMTPETIPEAHAPAPMPGRARHGPREIGAPSRANSMPVETPRPTHSTSPSASYQAAPNESYNGYPQDEQPAYDEPEEMFAQPDFLPQLPPSNRQRGSSTQVARQSDYDIPPPAHHQRALSHGLPHSYSAPAIPTMETEYHPGFELHTAAPEPLPDLDYQHQHIRQRMNDTPPGWENPSEDPYASRHSQYEEEQEPAPPPPPMHSRSAPVVPQYSPVPSPTSRYGGSPQSSRQQYIPNASPLQSIERGYGSSQHTPSRALPARGQSMDDYTPEPAQVRTRDSTPPSLMPGQTPSPTARSPATRNLPHRHSVADPYYATPPRPHPLSQELPRARSPMPDQYQDQDDPVVYAQNYRSRDATPLIKPRAISPRPPPPQTDSRHKSSYSLQFPVRSFESSDHSPLSTSQSQPRLAQTSNHSTPARKSISSMRPSPAPQSPAGGVPFGPDSFDVHNPTAGSRASPLANALSQSSPYHVRQENGGTPTREEQRGPIVGWDGREIDPSDHLPVDSWAPEPIKKTPTKTYGAGRDRDFGPRTTPGTSSPATGQRLSKDTVVNFRMKAHTQTPPQPPQLPELDPPASSGRIRFQKKSSPGRSPVPQQPLREHTNFNSVPNPYAQQDFSHRFRDHSPGVSQGHASRYDQQGGQYEQDYDQEYDEAPSRPPKVPMAYEQEDQLSREIANIDLGMHTGSTRRLNNGSASPAYTPVRSQRDRHTYY